MLKTQHIDQRPRVAILLASYNGADHIAEQLESIAVQTHSDWILIVSDDGSSDDTRALVAGFAARFEPGRVTLVDGPKMGDSSANFLSLLQCDGIAPTDYVAFCDQDDVWLPDRIERGFKALAANAPDELALYGGRTIIADEDLTETGYSPEWTRLPAFENALVQSFAGGNTFLMTPASAAHLATCARVTTAVIAHDWWAYMAISGAGGKIIYDTEPTLIYRQHANNIVGANSSLRARLRRIRSLIDGGYRVWNRSNIDAIASVRHTLTPKAQETFALFEALHDARGLRGLALLRKAGLYRQTRPGRAALQFAAFFGRL